MRQVASPYKIAWHADKLRRFLAGERILPATVEMDITTECNAGCHNCPSTRSPSAKKLDLQLVDRLFASLQGETRGLLLSGGEPTLADTFPHTLALARRHGFDEVTIVTNGSQLHRASVQTALLQYASAVRVSIYGWNHGPSGELTAILRKIERLRSRIEQERSQLEIGVSLLTSKETVSELDAITEIVRDSGAHWIYFHPRCTGWGTGHLGLSDQSGVAEGVRQLQCLYENFEVYICPDRYTPQRVSFAEYCTSHFLLVVGADTRLYLGTETKYQPHCVVGEITVDWSTESLWSPGRLDAIRGANSATYTAVGGMHRGILYSLLIQDIKDGRASLDEAVFHARSLDLRFPHVL